MRVVYYGLLLFAFYGQVASAGQVLGDFAFSTHQFGDMLVESDQGEFTSTHWLNVVNSDPGNGAYLTGANFDTGVANIGSPATPEDYHLTIVYDDPVANGPGEDLGVVVARYSSDDFNLAVSADGDTFTVAESISAESAIGTGVGRSYYFSAVPAEPVSAELFVHPIDLDLFGITAGSSIAAVRVSSEDELDLIRVAALVPEPATGAMLVLALLVFWMQRRFIQ